ncbi:MAG: MotA/TolQ/ExbB proton channel family protein [Hyphomicrobium sp.]|nr:MotA/TolQ/ExbB proton channel family protein [Hyphomicrobium sp.]
MNELQYILLHEWRAHLPLIFVALALLAGIVSFLIWFVAPARRLRGALKQFNEQLKALRQDKQLDPRRLDIADERFAHLWDEYCDTLHRPNDGLDPLTGAVRSGRHRATVPAEVIFNSLSVFEGRIHAEFFKHMPGLLTGLGIIGTFIGLINGLGAASSADGGLNTVKLIGAVREAFYVSAAAIILAMVVTAFEKYYVAGFHRAVEQLCESIDKLYTAGAGEEYLARLVHASEESASQSAMLKDALVGELSAILERLAERQIEASARHQTELARQLGSMIDQGVGAPIGQMTQSLGAGQQSLQDSIAALNDKLERVASGIERMGESHGSQIADGLSGSMATFADRLDQLLGGQIGQARDLQTKTMESLEKAIGSIESVATTIGRAGEDAASAMSEQLGKALTDMSIQQRTMADSLRAVADEMRGAVAKAQTETSQGVGELLSALGGQVAQVIGGLQSDAQALGAAQGRHIEMISETTQASVGELAKAVQSQTEAIDQAANAMRSAVAELGASVASNIERMAHGAGEIRLASEQFIGSGRAVSDILDKSKTVAGEFGQLASVLVTSAQDVRAVVADYRTARENFASLVAGLNETISNARRDASMTSELVRSLEGAASKLVAVQGEADAYLAKVSDVIRDAHGSFTTSMAETVKQANADFHVHLRNAVSLLGSSIEELESVLSNLSETPKRVA